jgi:hypothetical protein
MSWRKEVGRGGTVPNGWRMAWYEPQQRVGVYFPILFHWLLRGFREFKYRVHIALDSPRIERAEAYRMQRSQRERERLAEEYARGYMAGWQECFRACLDAVEEEIACASDAFHSDLPVCAPRKRPLKN